MLGSSSLVGLQVRYIKPRAIGWHSPADPHLGTDADALHQPCTCLQQPKSLRLPPTPRWGAPGWT